MKKLRICTKEASRTTRIQRSLTLSRREYNIIGVFFLLGGEEVIFEFTTPDLDDNLDYGLLAFAPPNTVTAELDVESIFANEKHNAHCHVKETSMRIIFSDYE